MLAHVLIGEPDSTSPGHALGSEESERLCAVADQHVLGVLIVVQHHLVVFTADPGLLVTAEGGVRRVGVIAVGPDAAGLDCPAEAVGAVAVAGPDAGTEAIERIVGNAERIVLVLEPGDFGSTSSSTMLASLPPSSSVIRFNVAAALAMTF